MSESKPTLRREQIAGMNIHYIMWSLDYFLDVQQRLGFESIELWCAEPHATENFDMERIGAKLEAAMAALHEAHDALEGYEEAIEADHNSVGSVKLV